MGFSLTSWRHSVTHLSDAWCHHDAYVTSISSISRHIFRAYEHISTRTSWTTSVLSLKFSIQMYGQFQTYVRCYLQYQLLWTSPFQGSHLGSTCHIHWYRFISVDFIIFTFTMSHQLVTTSIIELILDMRWRDKLEMDYCVSISHHAQQQ